MTTPAETSGRSAVPDAPAATHRPGLRERKKERTRRSLRDHALRLIEEQGYAATTVEQIAEAADVSPSTFFRYFPSKEDAVVADFMDEEAFRQVMAAPAELGPVAALRYGMRRSFEAMSDEDWTVERRRSRVLWSVPELRGGLLEEMIRPMRMTIAGAAQRLALPESSLEARVFGGAIIGGLLGLLMPLDEEAPEMPESRTEVLAGLEAGLDLLETILTPPT